MVIVTHSFLLSYLIPSYPIISYPILSYPIISYPIISHPILSYLILSCPIISYPIISYPFISYHISSYPILSYPIMSCRLLLRPMIDIEAFMILNIHFIRESFSQLSLFLSHSYPNLPVSPFSYFSHFLCLFFFSPSPPLFLLSSLSTYYFYFTFPSIDF